MWTAGPIPDEYTGSKSWKLRLPVYYLLVQWNHLNPAKHPSIKTNTDRTRPPRPPPPSREPSSGSAKLQDSDDDEEILTEEEGDGVCKSSDENLPTSSLAKGRVVTNPRLYQLTSLGQSTGLWWDSFEEDLEELGMGGENTYCVGFHWDFISLVYHLCWETYP